MTKHTSKPSESSQGLVLAVKTDNPVTELYLLTTDADELGRDIWESGKQLSLQLLQHIHDLLVHVNGNFTDISGIVAFAGPGSFTGLRIGLAVANSIAYGQQIPIVATSGDSWLVDGMKQLRHAEPGGQVLPEYGGEANITKPRK